MTYKYLCFAHTEVQYDMFLRAHGLSSIVWKRVRTDEHLFGYNPQDVVIVQLDHAPMPRYAFELVHRGARFVQITEPVVLGKIPLL